MRSSHHRWLDKIKQNPQRPHKDGFSFLLHLFSVFLLVCFCLYFLHYILWNKKRKDISVTKLQVAELFRFSVRKLTNELEVKY